MTQAPSGIMNAARFKAVLAAYGSDPSRWPADERVAALAFLDSHKDEMKTEMADAALLDTWLDTAANPANDTALLKARILRNAQSQTGSGRPANDHPVISPPGRAAPWRAIAATLILTTGIGFSAGHVAAAQSDLQTAQAMLSIAAPGDFAQNGWDEVLP